MPPLPPQHRSQGKTAPQETKPQLPPTAGSECPLMTLRRSRNSKRISQLTLAMQLGVSQRHISFVESGRSRPSRALLMAWLQALEAPLTLRNEILVQMGFAPAYSQNPLHAPVMAQANEALQRLLTTHDPMPAVIIDPDWNLLGMNKGAEWLMTLLLPWLAEHHREHPSEQVNMLDLLIHPQGFTECISNLADVGPALLMRIQEEATCHPSLLSRQRAFAALLQQKLGADYSQMQQPVAPILAIHFTTPLGEIKLFNMFTTFGTPQDITLASLRVEHMFAADEQTDIIIQQQAAPYPMA